jgi:hypothetical protein
MKTGLAKSLWYFVPFLLLFILAAGLIGTPQARAQDACDPTLYYYNDTFTQSDGPAVGWTPVGDPTLVAWAVENGEYSAEVAANYTHTYSFLNNFGPLSDYKVEVTVIPIGPFSGDGWRAGLIVRANPNSGGDEYDYYQIHTYQDGLRISKLVAGGTAEDFYREDFEFPLLETHTLGVEAKGNQLKFYYNGQVVIPYSWIPQTIDGAVIDEGLGYCWHEGQYGPVPPFLSGMIGLRVWGHTGTPHVHFDNFKYCELPKVVAIDIKPGSFPNSINLGSAGVTPVAILSDSTFDATQIDPATVSLAGAQVKLIGKGKKYSCGAQDINDDGLLDLVCHVVTAQFSIEPGSSVAVLEAKTFGGQAIRGEDSINIVPK